MVEDVTWTLELSLGNGDDTYILTVMLETFEVWLTDSRPFLIHGRLDAIDYLRLQDILERWVENVWLVGWLLVMDELI